MFIHKLKSTLQMTVIIAINNRITRSIKSHKQAPHLLADNGHLLFLSVSHPRCLFVNDDDQRSLVSVILLSLDSLGDVSCRCC